MVSTAPVSVGYAVALVSLHGGPLTCCRSDLAFIHVASCPFRSYSCGPACRSHDHENKCCTCYPMRKKMDGGGQITSAVPGCVVGPSPVTTYRRWPRDLNRQCWVRTTCHGRDATAGNVRGCRRRPNRANSQLMPTALHSWQPLWSDTVSIAQEDSTAYGSRRKKYVEEFLWCLQAIIDFTVISVFACRTINPPLPGDDSVVVRDQPVRDQPISPRCRLAFCRRELG